MALRNAVNFAFCLPQIVVSTVGQQRPWSSGDSLFRLLICWGTCKFMTIALINAHEQRKIVSGTGRQLEQYKLTNVPRTWQYSHALFKHFPR